VYSVHVFKHIRTGADCSQNNTADGKKEVSNFEFVFEVTINCYVNTKQNFFPVL